MFYLALLSSESDITISIQYVKEFIIISSLISWQTIRSEGPGSTQQLWICIENAGDKGKHQLSVQLFSSVSQKRRIHNTHRLFRAKNETDTLQVAPKCMGGDQNVSNILYVLRVRKKIKAIEHPQLAIMLPLSFS